MIRALTLILIFFLNSTMALGESSITNNDLAVARRIVENFQQIPAQHVLCSKLGSEYTEPPEIILPFLANFFSNEMLKLFSWIQCGQPEQPPPLKTERNYRWDFRYGLSISDSNYGENLVKNIKIMAPQAQDDNHITVKVVFNFYRAENTLLTTIYTLIRENGQWKIDDILLKGYSTEMEEILPGSKSLKTELQAAYKRAEAKYQRDQQTLKKK